MDLKTNASRIFGWVAVIIGTGIAASVIFVVSALRPPGQWELGAPVVVDFLFLLLAANLIYVGGYSLAHGSVPIGPRALFHTSDILLLHQRVRRGSTSTRRAFMAVLFTGCGYLAAQIAFTYAAHLPPGESFPWMVWILEFPAGMAFALATARAIGSLHRLNPGTLVATVGLLLMANLVATLAFVELLFIAWELAYIPAIVVNALFVARAQALLNKETRGATGATWMRCFGRLLWVGVPIGLVIGGLLCYFVGRSDWLIPAIQVTWGAMIGISIVPSQPDPITSHRG